jgi:predicted GNAT family N-acyltransferase
MKIIEPSTPEEFEKYFDLRFEILRKPWGQPKSSTQDEWEKISIHVLMINEQEEAVAVGRLQINTPEEGQIRSMAVRTENQGNGFGGKIIRFIEQKAKEKKIQKIILDARENAVHFYEKHGYRITGNSYLLFGTIKHFRMEKEMDLD